MGKLEMALVAALTLETGCVAETNQRVQATLQSPNSDCPGPQHNDAESNICNLGPEGNWNFTADGQRGWDKHGNWLIIDNKLPQNAVDISGGVYHYVSDGGGNPWKATVVMIGGEQVLVHERRRSWDEE